MFRFLNFIVFFSIIIIIPPCFSGDIYGIFMIVKGDIKIKTTRGLVMPIMVGSKVTVGDRILSGAESRAKIVMVDRNSINILPKSELFIKAYENNRQTGSRNVQLELTQGKVSIHVINIYDGEKNKFEIKTPTAVAGVLGTQFVMEFNASSRNTDITTLKGQVNLASIGLNGLPIGDKVQVSKGQFSSAVPETQAGAPVNLAKNDILRIAWEPANQQQNRKSEIVKPELAKSESTNTDAENPAPAVAGPSGDREIATEAASGSTQIESPPEKQNMANPSILQNSEAFDPKDLKPELAAELGLLPPPRKNSNLAGVANLPTNPITIINTPTRGLNEMVRTIGTLKTGQLEVTIEGGR
jgi:hypothetical protein